MRGGFGEAVRGDKDAALGVSEQLDLLLALVLGALGAGGRGHHGGEGEGQQAGLEQDGRTDGTDHGVRGPRMGEVRGIAGGASGAGPELSRRVTGKSIQRLRHGDTASGGGRGGNIIALVQAETMAVVKAALLAAGAKNVIVTTIGG